MTIPSWLVDGQADLHRLGHVLGVDLADTAGGRYSTLAGHLMWRLGRLPQPGERLADGGLEFEVESLSGMRPALVRVRRQASDPPDSACANAVPPERPAAAPG